MPSPQLASHWINGQHTDPSGSEQFEVLNPDSGEVIGTCARGTAADIEAASIAASMAYDSYRNSSPSTRESILLRAADLLTEDAEVFEGLLIQEIGSPISKARMEVAMASRVLRANAAMARQMTGRTYASDVAGRMSLALRCPLGVVAGITPFNVPLIKGVKHASMPLVTGNTYVWLPSEHTPQLALRLAELFQRAGLPDGAMNVVLGIGSEIGDALVNDPRVRCVSFTGSAAVGRHVHSLCGASGKRVTLEMGGKNPLIVLGDADLQSAVAAAIRSCFLYQGQICMAASRIIVEKSLYDAFSDAFLARANAIGTDGDLSDPQTLIGPIINQRGVKRIGQHIDEALQGGAKLRCGNRWNGNRVNPTVLEGVTPDMRMSHEETFGPVVSLQQADSAEHALELANVSPSILSAALFTNDLGAAMEFSKELRTAMVHINDITIQQEPEVPFGGDGQSGFGREGMQTGIEDFTSWKWITLNSK